MSKRLRWLTVVFLPLFSLSLTSCGDDEPNEPFDSTSSKEVSPEMKIITATSTKDEFTVAFRVKSVEKPSVTFYWSSHSSKTSSPSLNKHSSVSKTYEEVESSRYTWWYYKVTHAGFKPGQYVYYQVSATNSRGREESSIGYVIIKR